MSYQPKVINTQKYEDGQGSYIVTPAKLILISSTYQEVAKKVTNLESLEFLEFLDWCKVKSNPVLPVLISETGEIEEGDKVFDSLHKKIGDPSYDKNLINHWNQKPGRFYKVLALPEHFSDKHLQSIVGTKLNDGDKVLVKCENHGECKECQKAGLYHCAHADTCGYSTEFTRVHLDQQNHITLFPHTSTKEELIEELRDTFREDRYGRISEVGSGDYSNEYVHWLEELIFDNKKKNNNNEQID